MCRIAIDTYRELAIKPVDAAWTESTLEFGNRIEADQALLCRGHQQPAEGIGIVALTGDQTHGHRILLRTFLESRDLILTGHQESNRAGHVRHSYAEIGRERA